MLGQVRLKKIIILCHFRVIAIWQIFLSLLLSLPRSATLPTFLPLLLSFPGWMTSWKTCTFAWTSSSTWWTWGVATPPPVSSGNFRKCRRGSRRWRESFGRSTGGMMGFGIQHPRRTWWKELHPIFTQWNLDLGMSTVFRKKVHNQGILRAKKLIHFCLNQSFFF